MLSVIAVVLLLIEFSEINALWHQLDCGEVICYHPESPYIPENYVSIKFCNYDLSLSGECAAGLEVYEIYVPSESCSGENEAWWRNADAILCDCTADSRRDSNGICRKQTEVYALLEFFNNLSFHKLIESINNSPPIYNCGFLIGLLLILVFGLYKFHSKIGNNFTNAMKNNQAIQ